MDYWIATKRIGHPPEHQQPMIYAQLAQDTVHQHEVLHQMMDWFDSGKAKSAFHFGSALAEADRDDVLANTVSSWLRTGHGTDLVLGYLRELAMKQQSLPQQWQQQLDDAVESHPDSVALLTLNSDFSQAGLSRVTRLIESGALRSSYLKGFASPNWESALGVTEKAALVGVLLALEEDDQQTVPAVAMFLCACWSHYGKLALPIELQEPVLHFLRASLNSHVDISEWTAVVESLASSRPEEIAALISDALTSAGPSRAVLEDLTLKILLDIARLHPRVVMDAIGSRLLDPMRRPFFALHRFEGLFEAIGLGEVQRWVTEQNGQAIAHIAYQLDTPILRDCKPFIPPVTEWFMKSYSADDRVFREFCAGRHSFEIREGHARDRRFELERNLTPFLEHPLTWVRRWAEWELKENEYEATLDDYIDDLHERT
jgi:hypothetical protein